MNEVGSERRQADGSGIVAWRRLSDHARGRRAPEDQKLEKSEQL
jgi:hypothetical protein